MTTESVSQRPQLAPVPVVEGINRERFYDEIVPAYRPVVFRGLVSEWPAVAHARSSREQFLDYLRKLDSGAPLYTVVGDPSLEGRLFYGPGLRGVNFQRVGSAFSATLEQMLRFDGAPKPPAVAIQAAQVNTALPGFTTDNSAPLLDGDVEPTMWFGNRAIVAPHFDVHDNIACVVAGRRRFTLFPPDQIGNLYVGPILDAPGGVPISTVDIRNPDFDQFPRYREALAAAMDVVLEPGDAIYIPAPWWHGVESAESVNLLVNYWYGGVGETGVSPKASLMHSIMGLRDLPDFQRKAWGSFFDYFLFADEDPTSHWPEGIADIVTRMSDEQKRSMIRFLQESLPS